MKGILLISHGEMAKGMANSAGLFFGDDVPQMDFLCLSVGDSPEEFGERICQKVNELDSGDGVVILADLYGGTPCNQAIQHLNDKLDLISGMNFALLVQLLSERTCIEPEISSLIEAGRNGIINMKEMLSEGKQEEDWF